MIKNFQILNRILTRKLKELISLLFRKLDIDELIFLLRVLQRDIRAKYTLTKIIKKYQFKVRFINSCVNLLKVCTK